jgi:6,7-dimethyl-8-ribityllumazine synthase
MASATSNLSVYDDNNIPSAADLKIGIVVSDWNSKITHGLLEGCVATLQKHGANSENIKIAQVPGAFELPTGAKYLLSSGNLDAAICLGCVIKGETKHDEYISTAVANGIMNLSLASGKPVIFGVLTPNNEKQALDRAGGKYGNKGVEAAVTAIRMAVLKKELVSPKSKIGY